MFAYKVTNEKLQTWGGFQYEIGCTYRKTQKEDFRIHKADDWFYSFKNPIIALLLSGNYFKGIDYELFKCYIDKDYSPDSFKNRSKAIRLESKIYFPHITTSDLILIFTRYLAYLGSYIEEKDKCIVDNYFLENLMNHFLGSDDILNRLENNSAKMLYLLYHIRYFISDFRNDECIIFPGLNLFQHIMNIISHIDEVKLINIFNGACNDHLRKINYPHIDFNYSNIC